MRPLLGYNHKMLILIQKKVDIIVLKYKFFLYFGIIHDNDKVNNKLYNNRLDKT